MDTYMGFREEGHGIEIALHISFLEHLIPERPKPVRIQEALSE